MIEDAERSYLRSLLARRPGIDMKKLSLGLPRNQTYVQQYLSKGVPRRLPQDVAIKLANELGGDPARLGAVEPTRSYFDLLLFPIRHDAAPECRADFQIPVRRLVARTSIICPSCGVPIDLEQAKWAIDDLARLAAALDKMTK